MKATPWNGWESWCSTRDALHSSDEEALAHAVRTVAFWETSASEARVPAAIASTVAVRVARSSACSDPRSALALAIVRFVNHVADDLQRKSEFAQPILALCASVGISKFLVDLRHDSTHGDLPSLELLLLGSNEVLEWLRTNYWCEQSRNIEKDDEYDDHWDAAIVSLLVSAFSDAQKNDWSLVNVHLRSMFKRSDADDVWNAVAYVLYSVPEASEDDAVLVLRKLMRTHSIDEEAQRMGVLNIHAALVDRHCRDPNEPTLKRSRLEGSSFSRVFLGDDSLSADLDTQLVEIVSKAQKKLLRRREPNPEFDDQIDGSLRRALSERLSQFSVKSAATTQKRTLEEMEQFIQQRRQKRKTTTDDERGWRRENAEPVPIGKSFLVA